MGGSEKFDNRKGPVGDAPRINEAIRKLEDDSIMKAAVIQAAQNVLKGFVGKNGFDEDDVLTLVKDIREQLLKKDVHSIDHIAVLRAEAVDAMAGFLEEDLRLSHEILVPMVEQFRSDLESALPL